MSERTRKRNGVKSPFYTVEADIARALSRNAQLTVEQIGAILGIDIKKDERFRDAHFWDWSAAWEKPEYKAWKKRLEELAEYYKTHPLPAKMEFVPRKMSEEFFAYKSQIPGIETHRVHAVRGILRRNLLGISPEAGCLRLPVDVANIKMHNKDLVYKKSVPRDELGRSILDLVGVEVVQVTEQRKVWVAHYDGRPLKPYKQVRAPLPARKQGEKWKTGMASGHGRRVLKFLLDDFTRAQNRDGQAKGIIIIDETGIKNEPDTPGDWDSVAVSSESVWWEGKETDKDVARKWFKEEFGITFTEEVRPMKVYVVRRKGEQ